MLSCLWDDAYRYLSGLKRMMFNMTRQYIIKKYIHYFLKYKTKHIKSTATNTKLICFCSVDLSRPILEKDNCIDHGVDPLSYFSFQPVLHDWCSKGRGMCYPVWGIMHIKNTCC